MRKIITKTINKVKPHVERFTNWLISAAFQLMQLVALGWAVMSLIEAMLPVKYVVSGIVVFSAVYFTRIRK